MTDGTGPVVVIHGGAGTIPDDPAETARRARYEQALASIIARGRHWLEQGRPALDIAVECVRLLEECPLFNAGRGAVYTSDERHELDACVMRGHDRAAGAVAGVRRIRNPVLAARALLDAANRPGGSPLMLIDEAAETFARQAGCEMVAPDWFGTEERLEQLRRVQAATRGMVLDHDAGAVPATPRTGTVGCVVRDDHGSLAAATSTGGVTNKPPGRVGDSPIVGAGCFADDASVAVSCTGEGEVFIRAVAAHEVAALVRHAGMDVAQAADRVIHDSVGSMHGRGGLIAVDRNGRIALPFNTTGMYRAWARTGGPLNVAIHHVAIHRQESPVDVEAGTAIGEPIPGHRP